MQEGSFRCDANVSVRRPGAPLGTRREIKNLNSFRFLQQAIDAEVQWQIDLIEDGGALRQATVLFDPERGETREMRSKEDAHDYRYFPDPDLPPLAISPEWIERVRAAMPELPRHRAERFQRDFGLSAYDAAMMTQTIGVASYFEAVAAASGQPKLAANWIMGEVARRLNASGASEIALPAPTLAALIGRVADRTISNNAARQLFDVLWDEGGDVDALIDARGLRQVADSGELERIVDEVIAANAKSVAEFRAGKDKAFNALVGQAMKASKGKADPGAVAALLKKSSAEPSGRQDAGRFDSAIAASGATGARVSGSGPSEPARAPPQSLRRRSRSRSKLRLIRPSSVCAFCAIERCASSAASLASIFCFSALGSGFLILSLT
jgi:aspartyl-tRNA(Asn)/glutamyl-tRNA(Gln) amidotransferase subunit B